MDPAVALEVAAMSQQKIINDSIERGDSEIQRFYSNASVLVTGGSGFLGKQLIEKLFRSCKIKKLFLLLRPKKDKNVHQRLEEILKDPVYGELHNKQPGFTDRISAIEGDVAKIRLGVSDANWGMIAREVNVIFHVAATINFVESLKNATLTNIRGTKELLSFGKACKSLRSFVHVSTAYSHATRSRIGAEVLEQFYPSPVPPATIIQLAESVHMETLDNITPQLIEDWPNTYAFTKAIAEEAVRTMAGDLPICIVRPSIVIGTYREPAPGWLDVSSVYGPSGITLGSVMGVIHVVFAKQNIKIDFVPADYVNNAIIAAGWETGTSSSRECSDDVRIYNVTTSRNFLYWGDLSNILNNVVKRTIISPHAIWYCFAIQTTNKYIYLLLTWLLHYIPGYLIDGTCLLMGKQPRLMKIYSKIYKMTSVLMYYTVNDWVFNDLNIQNLYKKMSKEDKIIHNFDVTTIEWTEQIVIWCLGLHSEIMYHKMIKQICMKYDRNYTKELQIKMYGETDRKICLTVVRELKLPISADEFESQLGDMAQKMLPSAPLQPGAERLLTHLYDYNVPMALATNSTEQAVRLHATARPKLFGMFHHKVSATDPEVHRGKPNPDIYLVAAERFPGKPKPIQCLVFEDSAIGVEAAKEAGMQVVMIPAPSLGREFTRHASLVIRSLNDFKPELFGLPPFDDAPTNRKSRIEP